jgi:quercetin dioxygenase-like cupin family protein
MGYIVLRPEDQVFEPPSWRPEDPARRIVELPKHIDLQHSRASLWRYPAGAQGRRHREPVQEEVFVVLQGTLTMYLGEPPQRHELPPTSLAAVQPGTPLHLRNESDADVLVFAYGAPREAPGQAELIE